MEVIRSVSLDGVAKVMVFRDIGDDGNGFEREKNGDNFLASRRNSELPTWES